MKAILQKLDLIGKSSLTMIALAVLVGITIAVLSHITNGFLLEDEHPLFDISVFFTFYGFIVGVLTTLVFLLLSIVSFFRSTSPNIILTIMACIIVSFVSEYARTSFHKLRGNPYRYKSKGSITYNIEMQQTRDARC
ncbi:MAG: hypothetical protein MI702_05280 [Chlorobiales bacterium]|nr:hypothetical protein [Chlorobiales bacterium]